MPEERSPAVGAVFGTEPAEVVDFDVRADLGDYSLFDAFADVFTPPEHQAIHRPDTGRVALILDGFRIRQDFEKAFATFAQHHATSD